MTNNKIQKGIESLKKIKMSTDEELLLRKNLLDYVDKTLEVETVDDVKTYNKMPILSQYFNFSSFKTRYALVTFSIFGLFIIGAGAIGMSKSSLPGEALYSLKVKVVEPVEGLLMLTPVSKVNFEAKKIDSRLKETEALIKNNNLNKDNREVIEKNLEKNFEDHAVAFDNFINDTQVKNTVGTTTAQIEFEKNIDQHNIIFDKIKEDIPEKQKEEIKKIEDVVNIKMNEFKEDRKDDEEKFSQQENKKEEVKIENRNQNEENNREK